MVGESEINRLMTTLHTTERLNNLQVQMVLEYFILSRTDCITSRTLLNQYTVTPQTLLDDAMRKDVHAAQFTLFQSSKHLFWGVRK